MKAFALAMFAALFILLGEWWPVAWAVAGALCMAMIRELDGEGE